MALYYVVCFSSSIEIELYVIHPWCSINISYTLIVILWHSHEVLWRTDYSGPLQWNVQFGTYCIVIDKKILMESEIQVLATYYTVKSNLTCLYTCSVSISTWISNRHIKFKSSKWLPHVLSNFCFLTDFSTSINDDSIPFGSRQESWNHFDTSLYSYFRCNSQTNSA